ARRVPRPFPRLSRAPGVDHDAPGDGARRRSRAPTAALWRRPPAHDPERPGRDVLVCARRGTRVAARALSLAPRRRRAAALRGRRPQWRAPRGHLRARGARAAPAPFGHRARVASARPEDEERAGSDWLMLSRRGGRGTASTPTRGLAAGRTPTPTIRFRGRRRKA